MNDSPIHGLSESLDSRPIVNRPSPQTPIRAITADQLAEILHKYNSQDVDDSVLFPFLHGLEGSNIAQNLFFSHARHRGERARVPRYRGLVLVRVDEQGLELDTRGNVRNPSPLASASSDEEEDDDDDDDDDDELVIDDNSDEPLRVDTQLHMHPVQPRSQPLSVDTASPSTTSISISNYFPSPAPSDASFTNTSPPTTPASAVDPSKPSLPDLLPQQSQPQQRRPSHILNCSFHPDELLSPAGPVFLNPRIPEGISLRNFGIQVPIYATLSDIVIYSPKGPSKNAVALAERFKQAVEAKAFERGWLAQDAQHPGQFYFTPESVTYNVYIVTDPFETFEKKHPHLVAIDSQGNLVRKIDFMEREKEEMRTLTQASEIADGVFLGNTADVPLLVPPQSSQTYGSNRATYTPSAGPFDPFDSSNNPGGYDICIECHDMASFPSVSQLRSVEDRLRALEDAWRGRVREKEQSAEKERVHKANGDSDSMEVDGLGLALETNGDEQNTTKRPLSPTAGVLMSGLSVSSTPPASPSLGPSSPPSSFTKGHARSRTAPTSSYFSTIAGASGTRLGKAVRQQHQLPPRPAPNASQVIHLQFPSSPQGNATVINNNLIPFLHFIHSLAKPRPVTPPPTGTGEREPGGVTRNRSPSLSSTALRLGGMRGAAAAGGSSSSSRMRSHSVTGNGPSSTSPSNRTSPPPTYLSLSRPLRILLHAGDGYTETSVLALSYLMLTEGRTLPEAYLELQVQRGRSFFVYGSDVGVLRRVEGRLKAEREKERERNEKMAAAVAAATAVNGAASVGTNAGKQQQQQQQPQQATNANGAGSRTVGANTTSLTGNVSRWWRTGLPSGWRTGSLSGAGVTFLNGAGMFTTGSPTTASSKGGEAVPEMAVDDPPVIADSNEKNGLSGSSSFPSLFPSSTSPSEIVYDSASNASHQKTVSGTTVVPTQRPASLSQSYAPGQPPAFFRRARASTSPFLPSFVDHDTWFNDPKFDGSFPSRVLPFLYLGNLAHAGNAYMLHALGITHVVSVGECALVPPPTMDHSQIQQNGTSSSYPYTNGVSSSCAFIPGRGGHGSLWMEEKEGRIKVLDIKGVCDDGIDSLRPQIAATVEWIDKARAEGGKVLVHCRVGVSRSATVTIAYVMHHLNVSLVDAYLMVRSRRLSVLIQPNMRLLYNLCGWETELAKKRAIAESREIKLGEGRQFNWPFLAREVHILNERYLS